MYYLLLAIFYPISLLPFPVLYWLSDAVYVVLYKWAKYRVPIVRDNLLHAFPEKSAAERRAIEQKFYHSFCDQWVETIKLLSISKKQLLKRFVVETEPLIECYRRNIACHAMMAHNFNFEWANVGSKWSLPQAFGGIYMPLTSKAVERFMVRIRGRAGSFLIPASNFRKQLQELKGTCYVLGLVADQNPANRNKAQWELFLNREAPFYRGPAEGAIRENAAVAFTYMHKTQRGHYHLYVHLLTYNAAEMKQTDITRAFVHYIEEKIKQQPENYLWTHRRWKHKREDYPESYTQNA